MMRKSTFLFGFILLTIVMMSNESCVKPVCTELACQNGGICRDGFCQCKKGWEGTECTVKSNHKFTNYYIGALKPGDGLFYLDSLLMLEDTLTTDTVWMSFAFAYEPSILLYAQVHDVNHFTVNRTLVNSDTPYAYMSGNGILEDSKLTFFFQYFRDGDTTISSTFFGEAKFRIP